MAQRLFSQSLRYHHRLAATTAAGAGLFGGGGVFQDNTSTLAEPSSSSSSTGSNSFWGWKRRWSETFWTESSSSSSRPNKRTKTTFLVGADKANQTTSSGGDTTANTGFTPGLFQDQCLARQVYQPRLPYPAWDYNWDGRVTDDTCMAAHKSGKAKIVNNTKKTRHIILIRHGQYNEDAKDNVKAELTELGRQQAIKTGRRLAAMAKGSSNRHSTIMMSGPLPIRKIHVSNMVRAKQTAKLIAQELQRQQIHVQLEPPDPTLNEALPAPMIPLSPESMDSWTEQEIDENSPRVQEAFEKYFYRKTDEDDIDDDDDSSHELDDFEIVVCHGNMIRYFFCRALQIPPEAWLRMSIYNCSMTYLTIRPNGTVSARMLGDIGHLDYDESTYSANTFGFKW